MNKIRYQLAQFVFAFMVICSQTLLAASNKLPGPALKQASLDERFSEVAKEVPAFGGMFYDENGDLNIYLTNPLDKDHAKRKLREVFGEQQLMSKAPAKGRGKDKRKLPAGEMRVLQGRYPFEELDEWRKNASDVLGIEGAVFTDLDEAKNRIVVGIADPNIRPLVESTLASYGIPLEAAIISEVKPVTPLATVRDYIRPTKGGLQINFGGSACTLGFNAYRAGVRGFVTNSHCSNTQGVTEGTEYFQGGGSIGWETADPAYFTSIWPWECMWGYRCRYSDSIFARYNWWTSSNLGRIARTTSWSGSITINDSSPEMTIVSEIAAPSSGQILDKIGRTTGWTYGRVTGTCVDVIQTGTNILMKCQDRVESWGATIVAPGDSGSPVFQWGGSTVNLSGILWGGSGTEFWFSRMGNIERELGALTTF